MICVGDGLYSKEPMIDLTVKSGMSFIYVAKPDDYVALEQDLSGLRCVLQVIFPCYCKKVIAGYGREFLL